MKKLLILLLFLSHTIVAQITDHPRLFVNQNDLPTLRSWAVNTNPFFANGLKPLAEEIMSQVQSGVIPNEDPGGSAYSPHFTEGYAHVLAFMAMVDPDATRAAEYRATAISLLMYIMDIADLGVLDQGTAEELRYRRRSFSTSDRSRWIGQAFPLTVDWVYDYLTADQKKKIRRVFLRWAEENITGYPNHNYYREGPDITINPSNYNSPVWLDLEYDPIKKRAIRYAMNNYFNAHIRNVVMMAAAFDEEDDVADPLVAGDYDGRLREYREKFLHTWHYMADYAYRYENNGGVSAEGGEYMPALGFTLQLMLALHTAGYDPQVWGEKISIESNPHWERTVPALINSLPKHRTYIEGRGGWCYQPSWFGDGEHLHVPDVTDIFGPLGVYARLTNKTELLEAVKWIIAYVPPGSIERMLNRIDNKEDMTNSIMAFMTFDPASANTVANGSYPEPHETIPNYHFAHGAGRFSNRTSWNEDARWVNYRIGFITIDHQHGDGNMFDFFRKGEWLTKERTGYGNIMGSSDYKNTLAIKRNTDDVLTDGFYGIHGLRGSQFRMNNDGDPTIVANSVSDNHFFVTGDATNLYNYVPDWGDPIRNVQHASRSFYWIKPDYLVVYDRVETNYNGFKQFWLNLPSATPTITDRNISASTPGGQKLVVSSLLPADAELTLVSEDPMLYTGAGIATPEPYPAEYDPMGVVEQTGVPNPWDPTETITLWHPMRLRVEATGNPLSTRFLHVLQGRDGNQEAVSTSLVSSSNGMFEGAVVGNHVVMFKRNLTEQFASFDFTVPANIETVVITGLDVQTSYATSVTNENGLLKVSITEGNGLTTDTGGVLSFNLNVAPRNIVSVATLSNITVSIGTDFNSINFPQTVSVTFNDNSSENLPVTFSSNGYNQNAAGSYTLTGSIQVSGNLTNTQNLTASITVIVSDAPNNAPTDISLSNIIISEEVPVGSLVGNFTSSDIDQGDSHTYALVNGTGSDQNSFFTINGNSLLTNASFNVVADQQFSIRVQSVDQHGGSFTKVFLITIQAQIEEPVGNNAPTDIILSNNAFQEQQSIGTIIGQLSAVDQDVSDTHTYIILSGGDNDGSGFFSIVGNTLISNYVFEISETQIYSLRIQVTDQNNASYVKDFEIHVLPVDFFIPTVFSPNGDGMNDRFRIRARGLESIRFRIFDRFGNVLFETNDIQTATETGWDGSKNGSTAPAGIYTWIMQGRFNDGKEISIDGRRSGNVLLVR